MSERLLTAGGQVGAFAGQVAREMPRASAPMGFLSGQIERLGLGIDNFAIRGAERIERWGRRVGRVMEAVRVGFQNAHLVMAGMFSGVMLAQANDLAGKITALGGAVTSMVMAF